MDIVERLTYTQLLRKVCKFGKLHYRFSRFHGALVFHVFDKLEDECKHRSLVKQLLDIAGPTWCIPDGIAQKEDLAEFALFHTSLLERVFDQHVLSYEQLCCLLDLHCA